jgi:two-component system response regulator AtoC
MARVLIIDDEKNLCEALRDVLIREGYDVAYDTSPKSALDRIKKEVFDFVLCDIVMPELDGLQILPKIKELSPESVVIMMSAYGTVDTAIECLKKGADDYISKPFKKDEVILTIKKCEERQKLLRENIMLKRELKKRFGFENIIWKSKIMEEVIEKSRKVAPYKVPVLITGESGTGKELIARAIHLSSGLPEEKFVPVNCAAIPENLLESELFGYMKGAFTGAVYSKKGLLEEADGGTVFFDEIGDMPLPLQVKILRFLQDGEIRRIGEASARKVDVRVICATSRDLSKDVKDGRFREDLFYRINVITISIPPLRERKEDIPVLVEHFIKKFSQSTGKSIKGVSPSCMKMLIDYPWYGNVRELENQIERAIVLCERDFLDESDFPSILEWMRGKDLLTVDELSIKKHSQALERELIIKALKRTRGNKSKAAKLLDISLRALLYKIKEYKIEEELEKD